jgi:hypothetical protein
MADSTNNKSNTEAKELISSDKELTENELKEIKERKEKEKELLISKSKKLINILQSILAIITFIGIIYSLISGLTLWYYIVIADVCLCILLWIWWFGYKKKTKVNLSLLTLACISITLLINSLAINIYFCYHLENYKKENIYFQQDFKNENDLMLQEISNNAELVYHPKTCDYITPSSYKGYENNIERTTKGIQIKVPEINSANFGIDFLIDTNRIDLVRVKYLDIYYNTSNEYACKFLRYNKNVDYSSKDTTFKFSDEFVFKVSEDRIRIFLPSDSSSLDGIKMEFQMEKIKKKGEITIKAIFAIRE